MTAEELAQAIDNVHHRINQFFYTGIGVLLQKMDSDIAEEIMLHFLRKGEVVLPVHDSFLVKEHLADDLLEVMRDVFLSRCPGQEIGIKKKDSAIQISQPTGLMLDNRFRCYRLRQLGVRQDRK